MSKVKKETNKPEAEMGQIGQMGRMKDATPRATRLGISKVVKFAECHRSPTNPRKTFARLEELADSIRESGMAHALLVRPWPQFVPVKCDAWTQELWLKGKGGYEIVDGERRHRASEMLGLTELPIMVQELTDEEVVEIQLISFAQREDVSALEEGESFRQLIDAGRYTADTLAVKLGLSRGHVFNRLKLLKLAPAARQALSEGKVEQTVAVLLAGIPDEKAQAKALKEVTDKDYRDETMSFREAQSHIERNYMVSLKDSVFDQKDATLVPSAGSCEKCPKRIGVKCTDTVCFAGKKAAHFKRVEAAAVAEGREIMGAKEYEKIRNTSNYVALDDDVYTQGGGYVAWRKLLKESEVKPILARTFDGLVEILPKTKAMEEAKRLGACFQVGGSSNYEKRQREESKAKKEKKRINWLVVSAVKTKLRDGLGKASGAKLWRFVADCVARRVSWEQAPKVLAFLDAPVPAKGLDANEAVEQLFTAQKTEEQLQAVTLASLVMDGAVGQWDGEFGENFAGAAALCGVDLKAAAKTFEKPKVEKQAKPKAKAGKQTTKTKTKGKK